MVRIWIVAVMAAVGIVLLTGCAAWHTARGSEQQDQIRQEQQQPRPPAEEITDARREVREVTAKPAVPQITRRPPGSTLSYGGKTVTAALGSYCWIDLCTDTDPPVPDEREALAIPSGAVLVFDYGGEEPPSKVWAGHSPLVRGKVGTPTDSLPAHREGERTEIPAALPAGEYLIDVFVRILEGTPHTTSAWLWNRTRGLSPTPVALVGNDPANFREPPEAEVQRGGVAFPTEI